MNSAPVPIFRVEIQGDLAVAAYFLMANWPNPQTVPILHASGGPLAISFEGRPQVVAELRATLSPVSVRGGLLAKSAKAWLELVAQWDLEDTQEPSPGFGAAAG